MMYYVLYIYKIAYNLLIKTKKWNNKLYYKSVYSRKCIWINVDLTSIFSHLSFKTCSVEASVFM